MTKKVIEFFKYNDDLSGSVRYADTSLSSVAFFTDNEISHMVDVRSLITKIFILLASSFIILVILISILTFKNSQKRFKNIGIVFITGSSIVIFLFILLFILSWNFSSLFDNFHLIFFPQGNYMFEAGSLLITLFPFNFFFQFFLRLVITSSILSAILLFTGIFLLNVHKIFKKKVAI